MKKIIKKKEEEKVSNKQEFVSDNFAQELTHLCRMDSSISVLWTGPFPTEGVSVCQWPFLWDSKHKWVNVQHEEVLIRMTVYTK